MTILATGASTKMLTVALLFCSASAAAELNGTITFEAAHNTSGNQGQKNSAQLDFEWAQDIGEQSFITVKGRSLYDRRLELGQRDLRSASYSGINGPLATGDNSTLALRELYIDTQWAGANWRIGKQQVVWGEADGLKVLDKINPQSYREFILDDFDDSRIATWMLNAEFDLAADSALQLLWIADPSFNQMAPQGSDYAFTSAATSGLLLADKQVQLLAKNKPGNSLANSEFGLRYSGFRSGWDFSVNYLYHFNDFAVPYRDVSGDDLFIRPEYKRSHLLGASASNAFGELALRAEVAYSSDSYHTSDDITQRGIARSDELASVVGLDWHGISDTMLSLQWAQSHLLDYSSPIYRARTEHTVSALVERHFFNQTLTFETLVLLSVNNGDGLIQPKLSYNLHSETNVWLGADIFYGSTQGLYGQFKNNDRLYFGYEQGF